VTDAPDGQPLLLAHTTFNDAVFPVTVNEPLNGAAVTEVALAPEPVWLPTMGLPTTVVRVTFSCTPLRATQLLGARIEVDVNAELTDVFSGADVYPRSLETVQPTSVGPGTLQVETRLPMSPFVFTYPRKLGLSLRAQASSDQDDAW